MAQADAKKFLRSRGGLRITLNDENGRESFVVETPAGQKFLLQDGPDHVEISDSSGNSVKLQSAGITITSAATVTLNASVVEVNAGMVNVNSAMSKFSGAVQCDALISNSVVSASYSAGAGNIW
jgi:hypothetical protein